MLSGHAVGRRPMALATSALVLVTAIWGATFIVVKDAIPPLGPMPVLDFLVWRFSVATLAMAAVRPRAVGRLGPAGWRRGILLGLALGTGYVTQTLGLQSTPAGVSGFITGMFVVFTPLVGALVLRHRVTGVAWGAVALATGGLALLSVGSVAGQHGAVGGVLLTLACAVAFAVHIVGLGEWSARHEPVALAVVQLATVTALCALAAAVTGEGLSPPPDGRAWLAIGVTAVAATAFAFFVQTWAQSLLEPTRAAVIMTMEPVFAGVFAVGLAAEHVGGRTVTGSLLVLGAMFLVELGPRHGADADVSRLEA